jgi:hypothetical protein
MTTTKRPGFSPEPDNRVTTDPPSDGQEYVRKNGAWSVSSGGGGGGGSTFESISKNLNSLDFELTYSGGNLSQVVYENGVVKTFNYTGGNLTSVVLSNLPGGLTMTKVLSYTNNELAEVSYV